MWHIGIDLHRKTLVLAAVHDSGEVRPPASFECSDTEGVVKWVTKLRPFRAVVEATGTYRWLYRLLRSRGQYSGAPADAAGNDSTALQDRSARRPVAGEPAADQPDSLGLHPLGRIPTTPRHHPASRPHGTGACPGEDQLAGHVGAAQHPLALQVSFGPRGLYWFSKQDFGLVNNAVRDELLERFQHYQRQMDALDAHLAELRPKYPQVEVLVELYGIGLFSALLIVGELGEVDRFRHAKQAGAYTGLTPRVSQSGEHNHHGHVSRQGSAWLRWILIEAAMKLVREDVALANFYTRIRKRSSAKIARVAAARKLAEICWKRLRRWHRQHDKHVAA